MRKRYRGVAMQAAASCTLCRFAMLLLSGLAIERRTSSWILGAQRTRTVADGRKNCLSTHDRIEQVEFIEPSSTLNVLKDPAVRAAQYLAS